MMLQLSDHNTEQNGWQMKAGHKVAPVHLYQMQV